MVLFSEMTRMHHNRCYYIDGTNSAITISQLYYNIVILMSIYFNISKLKWFKFEKYNIFEYLKYHFCFSIFIFILVLIFA